MNHREQSLWLRVGGYRLHARVWRNFASARPAMVLVHGFGVSSRYMIPFGRALAGDFDVYAPDLPGFGRSERPPHTLSLEELAETLAAWMDAAGLERAALLGNSLGCQIIAEAVLRHPHRADRLVLVGPTVDPHARSALRQMVRLLRDVPYETVSLAAIVAWDYLTCGPVRLWRTLQFALQDRIEEKLPRIAHPTLIVRGDHDPLVPQAWAEEARSLLPDGRLAIVPDGAHAAHYSDPEELARLVRSFFRDG